MLVILERGGGRAEGCEADVTTELARDLVKPPHRPAATPGPSQCPLSALEPRGTEQRR